MNFRPNVGPRFYPKKHFFPSSLTVLDLKMFYLGKTTELLKIPVNQVFPALFCLSHQCKELKLFITISSTEEAVFFKMLTKLNPVCFLTLPDMLPYLNNIPSIPEGK